MSSFRFAISRSLVWILIWSTSPVVSMVPLRAGAFASAGTVAQRSDSSTLALAPATSSSRTVLTRVPAKYPSDVSAAVLGAYFTVRLTVSSAGDVGDVEISDWSITNRRSSLAPSVMNRGTVPASAEITSGREAVQLFTEAAKRAALGWRFGPADQESTETIAFAFAANSGGGVLGRVVRSVIPRAITDRIAAWYWPNTEPVRIGAGIPPPQKVVDVHPMYPGRLGELKASDAVALELHIRRDGSVADARILRSAPIFDRYALNAVLGWKYNPVLVDGKPVDALMPVTVNFTPPTGALDNK